MKAILLCAGKGTRLRPITDNIPKCLLPLNGRPLLERWLDNMSLAGISDVLINGHYLAGQLETYLEAIYGKYPFNINYIYEDELVGTGGTVRNNYPFIKDEEYFFMAHGDNFTDIDITGFERFHVERKSELSVALFKTDIPRQCGIVEEINEDGLIAKFTEKPEEPVSDLASAAMFILSPRIVETFSDDRQIDFSKEVLPLFSGNMYGYRIKGFNVDIGTRKKYEEAEKIAKEIDDAGI